MFIKESNKAQCMHDTAFAAIGSSSPFVEFKMKNRTAAALSVWLLFNWMFSVRRNERY